APWALWLVKGSARIRRRPRARTVRPATTFVQWGLRLPENSRARPAKPQSLPFERGKRGKTMHTGYARFLIVMLFFLGTGCGGGGAGGGGSAPGPAPAPQAPNQAPLADAGANQNVVLGSGAVQLDGSKSADPEGAPLQFAWTLTLAPGGS